MLSENPYLIEDTDMKSDQFVQKYVRLDEVAIYSIAHQPHDMIKSCKMRGRNGDEKCDELIKGGARVFTTRFGICYMFNPVAIKSTKSALVSNYGGPNFGLELIIDIESKCISIESKRKNHE